MSETTQQPDLPPELDAALSRLSKALAAKPAPAAGPSDAEKQAIAKAAAESAAAESAAAESAAAIKALQQKLAASEAQVARLRIALAGATSQRSAALAKVDSAVQQVEMLLFPAEGSPE